MTAHTQRQRHIAALAALAAGGHPGSWDEHGQPAPRPDEFFNPDTNWRHHTNNTPDLAPGQQPL